MPRKLRTKPVLIDYEVASVGRRIWAFMFDFGVLQLPYACFIFWLLLEGQIEQPVVAALFCLPVFTYHLLWESLNSGQSPGKRLMLLKVVKIDGTAPYFEQYLIRWACRLVDIIPYGAVAVLMILFAGKGQRLGDKLANTLVVKYDPAVIKELMTETELAGHQLVYTEAAELTHHQVALIRKILATYRKSGQAGPVQSLAEMLQQELKINETGHTPVAFLTQLGKDYEYLSKERG